MSFVDTLFNEVVTPFLEPRIKKTSIKAVKSYVKTIDGLRKAAIGLISMSGIAAILVTGVILVVVAIIGLLPINPTAALLAILVLGAILTGASGFLLVGGLREEVWLEKSKANDMIEAVLKPWPTAYSVPDPRKVFAGDTAQKSYDENRELKGSRAQRKSADESAYDDLEGRVPQGALQTLGTPEAALVTRSMDSSDDLRAPKH